MLPSAARTELGTPLPRVADFLAAEVLSPGFATLNGASPDDAERDEWTGPGSSKSPISSVKPDSLIACNDLVEFVAIFAAIFEVIFAAKFG